MFFKIDLLKNFTTGKHLSWSLFLIKLWVWRTSSGCFCQFDKIVGRYWAICLPSLLNQKQNVGCFLQKMLEDLHRLCFFCWLTCRKQKLVQSETLKQELLLLISWFWQFQVRLSPSKKLLFASLKPFKTDKRCFLFRLKSSFRSQDI